MYYVKDNKLLIRNINALDLVISSSGYATLGPEWRNRNIFSPFNRLYLVEEGSGLLIAGDQKIVMMPGMAYLIPANFTFSYFGGLHLKKLFFHFNLLKPNFFDLISELKRIEQLPFPAQRLERILAHYNGTRLSDSLLVKQCLFDILAEFIEAADLAEESLSNFSEHVRDTIAYIQENLSAKLLIDDLAARRFISRSSLTAMFRHEVGIPLGKYINDRLMVEAQVQLTQSNESIAAISHALGFCDQSYFTKCFKSAYGMTPSRYRFLQQPHND